MILGNNADNGEVQLGTVVRQLDDNTLWRLIDDRRSGRTEPSKDTDWQIQPGMETLLVSSARLAIKKFCEENKIKNLSELSSKLKELDADFLDIPDDPAKQNEFLAEFGRKQKKIADDYLTEFKPEINAVYQKSVGAEPTAAQLADIKDKISRTLIFLTAENLKSIRQEYDQYVTIFYGLDFKEKSTGTDRFHEVLKAYKSGDAAEFNELLI